MKTKTINLYKFDELTKEAQQKALDKYRYFNVDDYYWSYIELLDSDIFSNDMKKYFDLDRGSYIQFIDLEVKDYKGKVLERNLEAFYFGLSSKITRICIIV